MGLFKRTTLPDTVEQGLDLLPGERVLAFGTDPLGRYVIATTHGLHLQRQPPAYRRLDWIDIRHASFEQTKLTLEVTEGGSSSTLRVPLLEAGQLPEVVRERVTASFALQQHVPLRGSLGVTVTARRQPGSSDLAWGMAYDRGLDRADPKLAADAEQALAGVRSESGL